MRSPSGRGRHDPLSKRLGRAAPRVLARGADHPQRARADAPRRRAAGARLVRGMPAASGRAAGGRVPPAPQGRIVAQPRRHRGEPPRPSGDCRRRRQLPRRDRPPPRRGGAARQRGAPAPHRGERAGLDLLLRPRRPVHIRESDGRARHAVRRARADRPFIFCRSSGRIISRLPGTSTSDRCSTGRRRRISSYRR